MSQKIVPGLVIALAIAVVSVLGRPAGAWATPTLSNSTVWGCRPGMTPNPCQGSMATTTLASTTLQPRRVASIQADVPAAAPTIDCFYVYPTVVTLPRANAPKYATSEVRAIYRYQAARYSQVCRVFAPIYRQATLAGISAPITSGPSGPSGSAPEPAFELAYADVRDAWHDYLAHDNHGRGVVLIGHSQGSGMLIRLMREEIDGDSAERAHIVSAIVPGGNFTVAPGQRTGGDLRNMPTCATATEIGCVLAWSTFASRPTATALFGLAQSSLRSSTGLPTPGDREVACTNPAQLSGSRGNLEPITRSEPFPGLIGVQLNLMFYGLPPRAQTPWVIPGEHYTASCTASPTRRGVANVLRIRPADPWTITPAESPWPDWGLHLADMNLALGNLIAIVRQQAESYAAR